MPEINMGRTSLPSLREDLSLMDGGYGENGERIWLVYDPLKAKYFRVSEDGFALMHMWSKCGTIEEMCLRAMTADMRMGTEEIIDFIKYIVSNGLTLASSTEDIHRFRYIHDMRKTGILKKIIHNYLFFRVPLFNPDGFLTSTLPYVSFMFSRIFVRLILLIGLMGVILVVPQYDTFFGSFKYFFSFTGVAIYIVTLLLVKAVHELGHAYNAKRFRCKVPSMGVAFIVMMPVLYTDTTDVWKITDKKDRLKVVLAGIRTELYIAMLATFAWAVLPDGSLRSAAFVTSTSTWVSSLLINMSPFMRFDGYYAFQDHIGVDNLQPRAFEIGKWRLRKILFGIKTPPPEHFRPELMRVVTVYSWATWAYRFIVFSGIAFMVYYMTFKALGIILFSIEIVFFIIKPIWQEIIMWFKLRKEIGFNPHVVVTFAVIASMLALVFVPWKTSITLPAVMDAKARIKIYAPYDGKVTSVYFKDRQNLRAGDPMISFFSSDIDSRMKASRVQIASYRHRIYKSAASTEELQSINVLRQSLRAEQTNMSGLHKMRAKMTVASPISGTVFADETVKPGRWYGQNDYICDVVDSSAPMFYAYVDEKELYKIKKGVTGVFRADDPFIQQINVKVVKISSTASETVEYPMLAADFGGDIAETRAVNGDLIPVKGIYKVYLRPVGKTDTKPEIMRKGNIALNIASESIIKGIIKNVASVLIKESTF